MCTPAGLPVAKITVPAGRANLAQSLGARIPLLARAEGRGSSCLRMLRKTTATTPRPCRLRRAARESTDTRDRQHRRGEQCGKQRACATRRRGVRKQDFQSGATTGTLKVRAKRSTECAARAALQFNTCPLRAGQFVGGSSPQGRGPPYQSNKCNAAALLLLLNPLFAALGKNPPAGRACREHGPSCRTCAQCHYRRALCCHCSRASSRRMRSICRP